jgi:hypothetical protein
MVTNTNKQTKTPWPLVRERTIPTERPPLVDETFVDRGVSRGQRGEFPTVVNLSFLDRWPPIKQFFNKMK